MGTCQSTAYYQCPHPPPTPILATELCKQKAGFVAHQPVYAAGNIRVAMACLIISATLVIIMLAVAGHAQATGRDGRMVGGKQARE